MRPNRLPVIFFLLLCPTITRAQATLVQQCKVGNGGSATEFYTVTIASSGGTTGCTSNFTAGHALFVVYNQQTGSSDRTTSNISATGATVTWHKAFSAQNTILGPPGYFTGIFYACPGDITSPTSSIPVTVDMGATMTGITSIFLMEVSGITSTSCLDSPFSSGGTLCCASTQPSTTSTGNTPIANAGEFAIAALMTSSATATVTAGCNGGPTVGTCPSFGAYTVPSNGTDVESASTQTIESGVVAAAHAVSCSTFVQSSTGAGNFQTIITSAFIGLPPSTGHGPKGKIL